MPAIALLVKESLSWLIKVVTTPRNIELFLITAMSSRSLHNNMIASGYSNIFTLFVDIILIIINHKIPRCFIIPCSRESSFIIPRSRESSKPLLNVQLTNCCALFKIFAIDGRFFSMAFFIKFSTKSISQNIQRIKVFRRIFRG